MEAPGGRKNRLRQPPTLHPDLTPAKDRGDLPRCGLSPGLGNLMSIYGQVTPSLGPFLALPPPLLLSSWSPLPAFPLRSADSRGLCSACLVQTQRRQGSPAQPPRGPHTADRPHTAQGTADLVLLQGRPSKIVAPSPCCPEATREVTGRQVGGGLGLRVSPRRAMMPSCPWQQLPSYPGHPHFCMEAEPLSSAPKPGISTHFQQTL